MAVPTGGGFRPDLGKLTITPAGHWSTDSAGRAATFAATRSAWPSE